jgi:hypothetical protein
MAVTTVYMKDSKGKNIGVNSKYVEEYKKKGYVIDDSRAPTTGPTGSRNSSSTITSVKSPVVASAPPPVVPSLPDYGKMYMDARAKGDWQAMMAANKAANKARGLGEVVTAQKDIDFIKSLQTPQTLPTETPKTPQGTPTPTPVLPEATSSVISSSTTPPKPGEAQLRGLLNSMGFKNIEWDPGSKTVLVDGRVLDTTGLRIYGDRYYGTEQQIMDALKSSGIAVPQITPPVTEPIPSETDPLVEMLRRMIEEQDMPRFDHMDYEDARQQAADELNPQYDTAKKDLMYQTDIDLEKRGIYNSPLAAGIMAERTSDFEAGRMGAIAQRAGQISSESQKNAQAQQALYLQERGQRMDALAGLLQTLSSRELSTAQLTGVLNGIKTLAAQQTEADIKFKEASMTGIYNGKPTLDAQNLELAIANITGDYKGMQTLASKKFAADYAMTILQSAIARAEIAGKVTTQEDAEILGVPINTPTWKASEAAKERALRYQLQSMQTSVARASIRSDEFREAIAIWEQTGKAPDSAILKEYGVVPGTDWKLTPAEKLKQIEYDAQQADYELAQEMAEKIPVLQRMFGVDDRTATAIFGAWENPTKESAIADFRANQQMLKQQGVNTDLLWKAIQDGWDDQLQQWNWLTRDPIYNQTQQQIQQQVGGDIYNRVIGGP